MRVYVINLARSPERRSHMLAELQKTGLDYEIVTGIDGRELDMEDRTLADPAMVARNLIPAGAVGCALTHLEIYKKIAADAADEALILEDDVDLPPDLGSVIDAVAKHLSGAEVALLNYQANDGCQLSSRNSIELPSRLLALPVDVSKMDSTAAYIITRAASERMIKYAPPVRANADDWHFFYREGILDRIRCVWPQVVMKNPSLDSTMGSYSLSQPGLKTRVLGPIVRRNIPLVRQAVLYRRERIFRGRNQSVVVDAPFITQPSRLDDWTDGS